MNKTHSEKLSKAMLAFRIVMWVISIPIGAFVLLWVWAALYLDPGRFDRDRMNAIVDVVRHQEIHPEQWSEFRIDNFAKPSALRIVARGSGNVWAERTPDGALSVSIMTKDRGHLGEYGFAYSDIPLAPKTIGGKKFLYGITARGQVVGTPGRMDEPRGQVDDHWWRVWNPDR